MIQILLKYSPSAVSQLSQGHQAGWYYEREDKKVIVQVPVSMDDTAVDNQNVVMPKWLNTTVEKY